MVLDYNGCSVLRNTCILITTKHQETLDNSDDRDDELIKVLYRTIPKDDRKLHFIIEIRNVKIRKLINKC